MFRWNFVIPNTNIYFLTKNLVAVAVVVVVVVSDRIKNVNYICLLEQLTLQIHLMTENQYLKLLSSYSKK